MMTLLRTLSRRAAMLGIGCWLLPVAASATELRLEFVREPEGQPVKLLVECRGFTPPCSVAGPAFEPIDPGLFGSITGITAGGAGFRFDHIDALIPGGVGGSSGRPRAYDETVYLLRPDDGSGVALVSDLVRIRYDIDNPTFGDDVLIDYLLVPDAIDAALPAGTPAERTTVRARINDVSLLFDSGPANPGLALLADSSWSIVVSVPEPATCWLFAGALAGLAGSRRSAQTARPAPAG